MYILMKLPQFVNDNLATSMLLTLCRNVMNTEDAVVY